MAPAVQSQASSRRIKFEYTPEIQTIGKQKITLKENHDWKVEADGKVKDYHTLGRSLNRFLCSAEGLFRFGQFMERVPKFINVVRQENGLPRIPALDCLTSKSVASWTWLTTIPHAITMTPGVIDDVKEASSAWSNSSLTARQKQYKFEKAACEVTDAVSMYAYSASNVSSLFPSMTKIGAASLAFGDNATAVKDGISLKLNTQNYLRARAFDLSKATPAIKKTVEGTMRYSLIASAKDLAAFAAGCFGMLFMATGTAVLPAYAFATLSLASTVFAIVRNMCSETMTFKPINFFDHRHVAQITA